MRRQVALAQRPRIAAHDVGHFQPLEPRGAGEGKIQLVVVQDVEHHHVVPAAAQQPQAAEQPVPRSTSRSETSTIIPRRG